MNRTKTILSAGAAMLCFATGAVAQDTTAPQAQSQTGQNLTDAYGNVYSGTSVTTATIPSSEENYLDDRLEWSNHIPAKASPTGPYVYCIKPGTRLLGRSPTLKTVTITPTPTAGSGSGSAPSGSGSGAPGNGGTNNSPPTPSTTAQYATVEIDPLKSFPLLGDYQTDSAADTGCGADVPNPQPLKLGTLAYITDETAKSADFRGGFDYGVLAVPFKVQMTGKQAFETSASLGGYVGYRIPWMDSGLVFSPVFFAGASNISVPSASNPTTSETVAGLSYGGGLITTVKDSFQVGIVVGFDHVDSPTYQYNDKPWLSFEIGYSFAQ